MSPPAVTVTVGLVASRRVDLVCVYCGLPRTDYALVGRCMSGADAQVGVHSRCVPKIAVRARAGAPVKADSGKLDPSVVGRAL